MANTYTLITSTTIGSDQTSITLGSGGTIPQTYTDLILLCSMRTNRSNSTFDDLYIGLNGSFTGNTRVTYGALSVTPSVQGYTAGASYAGVAINAGLATSGIFSNTHVYIPNYTTATTHPFNVMGANGNQGAIAGLGLSGVLWSNASQAVTSILLEPGDGTVFNAGSSVYLYGVKNT